MTQAISIIPWLAAALVAYRVLMAYVATLPTSKQLRDDMVALGAEQVRIRLAAENLANKTREAIEKLQERQTQVAAAAQIQKGMHR